jgi:DNA repair exonuclease SbcCD ATPase subunit
MANRSHARKPLLPEPDHPVMVNRLTRPLPVYPRPTRDPRKSNTPVVPTEIEQLKQEKLKIEGKLHAERLKVVTEESARRSAEAELGMVKAELEKAHSTLKRVRDHRNKLLNSTTPTPDQRLTDTIAKQRETIKTLERENGKLKADARSHARVSSEPPLLSTPNIVSEETLSKLRAERDAARANLKKAEEQKQAAEEERDAALAKLADLEKKRDADAELMRDIQATLAQIQDMVGPHSFPVLKEASPEPEVAEASSSSSSDEEDSGPTTLPEKRAREESPMSSSSSSDEESESLPPPAKKARVESSSDS